MSLQAGTRVGPYELIGLLGVGGMGEVYRATDTNLSRQVAIKVLPAAFATDPERLARFEREARTLASLNHPNIAIIHGFEKGEGIRALVMELVEGPTLADRIAQGPIPVDEALPIARQIAEALEAAHEQGIIHRDLKPANIKLRPDGTVKVLDFGLAKALDPTSAAGVDGTASPTITSPAMMTGVGMLLGTAAYMSPEQARGKAVDKRSDIWAFGCVLYEMLTGKRAFNGDDVSDTMAAVLRAEPDWSVLATATPAAVRRLLRRCLQKDAKERLQDIGDARIEIRDAQATNQEVNTVALPASVRRRERLAWTLGVAALVVALAVLVTLYVRRAVPEPVVTRLDVVTPPTTDAFSFALSLDGRQLAFVADGEKGALLWIRPLDQVSAQKLAGTEGASYPFWAPDGRAIGFFAEGKLKRINLTGGVPQVLADAPFGRGGTWSRDDTIVFSAGGGAGLMRVTATGGAPVPVTHLADSQGSHRWPQFLPDGRRFIFLLAGQVQERGVYLGSLDGGEPRRVSAAETSAAYAPPGYLLRVSEDMLVMQSFDAERGAMAGEPIPVARAVGANDGTSRSAFSVSAAGVLAYRVAGVGQRQLVWMDRAGNRLGTIGSPDENSTASLAFAADGNRVALSRIVQGNQDIWLMELSRGVATRFTFHEAFDNPAVWSPDMRQVVFASTRNGRSDLFVKPASGATEEQPLLVTSDPKAPIDWSSDGHILLYTIQAPKTASDLWALPMIGERKPFPIVQTNFDEIEGQFSPDGRWIAYTSNESGRYEVYVRPFPEVSGKWQVSTGGGRQPRWKSDGGELFYVAPDNQLMAVPLRQVANARAMDVGAPVALFPTRLASGSSIFVTGFLSRAQYAVTRDGRFLMNVTTDDGPASPITIAHNWTAGLKK